MNREWREKNPDKVREYYRRWREKHPKKPVLTEQERFWSKVNKTEGCWEWTAGKRMGYGAFTRVGENSSYAHRVAYEWLVGPIPEGLHIDHLCRNRACVNPSHMEPVTREVNVMRGEGAHAINARKTHCKRGHPLSDDNMYSEAGRPEKRVCAQCGRMRSQQHYAKNRRKP